MEASSKHKPTGQPVLKTYIGLKRDKIVSSKPPQTRLEKLWSILKSLPYHFYITSRVGEYLQPYEHKEYCLVYDTISSKK